MGLTEPVVVSFRLARTVIDTASTGQRRVCLSYSEDISAWSDHGCWVKDLSDDTLTCACDHFGSYAGAYVLWSIPPHRQAPSITTNMATVGGTSPRSSSMTVVLLASAAIG